MFLMRLSLVVLTCVGMSCASYSVKKNPTDRDTGIRFYRPKPYLYVGPPSDGDPQKVTISLQYLPDYEEEYSIEVHPGLGVNSLDVSLENGWNLTNFKGTTDQKYAEILGSMAGMVSAAGGLARAPAAAPARDGNEADVDRGVPRGYYESVFWCDECGKKHLFGWRYIGFLPFDSCPVAPQPQMQNAWCDDLWALLPGGGSELRFVRISDVRDGKDPHTRKMNSPAARAPAVDEYPVPAPAPAPRPASGIPDSSLSTRSKAASGVAPRLASRESTRLK